jgi:hypothetical protein
VPSAPPPPTSLGQSLFGCRLEDLENLPPEERAKCITLSTPYTHASDFQQRLTFDVKQRGRWQAALAAKQAPLRAPCMSIVPPPTSKFQQKEGNLGLMVDSICTLSGLISGFGPPK